MRLSCFSFSLCHYPSLRFPCCGLFFLDTYPAAQEFFFRAHLLCCAIILLFAYPAVPYFFFALTLLCHYPAFRYHLPCCALYLFKKIFRTLHCCVHIPLFAYHLPCCAFIFLRTCFSAQRKSHLWDLEGTPVPPSRLRIPPGAKPARLTIHLISCGIPFAPRKVTVPCMGRKTLD